MVFNRKEYMRKYQRKNRDRVNANNRRSRAKHKEKNDNRSRKWQIEHRKRYREIARKVYHKVRDKVVEKLGNKCVWCGITDKRVLQIDHIKGGGIKERREIGTIQIYYKILKMDLIEVKKEYQLLCANCNQIKRYENRESYHTY